MLPFKAACGICTTLMSFILPFLDILISAKVLIL